MEEDIRPQYSQAIFYIDVDKIRPNPYQPRKEFDEAALASLADSIRQYGVLQPLVVTRKEVEKEDGGISVCYELIAGERRWRAARLAGLSQVPALIRDKEDNEKAKLEIALIENIQREDLNPVERAEAFARLRDEFNLSLTDIAKKIGRSREYVSNTVRILALPEHVIQALREGRIHEGHTRPLLMLSHKAEEQERLFTEIIERRLTVRDAEALSRRAAKERARKVPKIYDRDTFEIEERLAERFGTRVRIEPKDSGGKILIEFFSPEDLEKILSVVENASAVQAQQESEIPAEEAAGEVIAEQLEDAALAQEEPAPDEGQDDADLYSIQNFTI